jgi:uncharacterized protein YndB with AHSA1/START domain
MASKNSSNEIHFTRVYDVPVRAVWDAWTVQEQLEKWWGPRDFTITTHSKELSVGGHWRYTMHGPDGVDYPNITKYFVVEPYKKLVYDHGATQETPPIFRVAVNFTESAGKTTMEMTFSLSSPEAAAEIGRRIKQANGYSTWDRLAEHLEERATGRSTFVINRSFEAPIARVFEMWTQPEHLAKWLPPAGSALRFLSGEIAAGKSTFFVITGAHGTMHVRAEYLEIEPSRRIVYLQQFVDEQEQPAPAPGAEVWPTRLRTTVLLTEEEPDRTRVRVTSEPEGEVSLAEIQAFVQERSGMTMGWTGSFDVLETLLEAE